MICRRSFRLSSSPVTRSHRSTQETRGMSRIYERKAVKLTEGEVTMRPRGDPRASQVYISWSTKGTSGATRERRVDLYLAVYRVDVKRLNPRHRSGIAA